MDVRNLKYPITIGRDSLNLIFTGDRRARRGVRSDLSGLAESPGGRSPLKTPPTKLKVNVLVSLT